MRLKPKLMLAFFITVLVTAAALAPLGLYQTSKQATESVNNKLSGLMSGAANELDGWLKSNAKVVETLALVIQEGVQASALNDNYFSIMNMGSNQKDIADLYFAAELDGTFINGSGFTPAEDYDPRERQWYKDTKQADKLIFTDPYVDNTTKKFAVSIAMPVKEASGDLRGVVASDILLSKLTDTVNGIDLGGLGYTFMLDKKGVILAHPNAELTNTPVSENDELGPLLAGMQASPSGQKFISL